MPIRTPTGGGLPPYASGNEEEGYSLNNQLSAEIENLYMNQIGANLAYHQVYGVRDLVNRTGAGMAVRSSRYVHRVGGYDRSSGDEVADHVQIDTNLPEAVAKTDLPAARNKPAAGSISGIVYIAGGYDSTNSPTNTIWGYNPTGNDYDTTLTSMPEPVALVPGIVYNGKLYVVFGNQSTGCNDTIQIYNPSQDNWSQSSSAPYWGSDNVAGVLTVDGKDYIYVLVSVNSNQSWGTPEVLEFIRYDIAEDNWETGFAPYPIDYGAGSSGVINNILYQVGGHNWDTGDNTNRVFAYVPEVDSWFEQEPFPRTQEATLSFATIDDNTAIVGNDHAEVDWDRVFYKLSTRPLRKRQLTGAVAYLSTNQSFSSGSKDTIVFDKRKDISGRNDIYGEIDLSTGKFIAKRNGDYAITVYVGVDSTNLSDQDRLQLELAKNGSTLAYRPLWTSGSGDSALEMSLNVNLIVGDYIEAKLYQSTGNTIDVKAGTKNTLMSIAKVD